MSGVQRYSDELRRGFVVRSSVTYPATQTRTKFHHTAWWYGPGHGFGTTFGTLDHCIAVFPSRRAAERAIDTGYFGANRGRLLIETVSDARRIRAAHLHAVAS